MKNKLRKLTAVSLVNATARALIGPITLLFISYQLSDEILGIYYIFFSILAMKQLLEVGIGSVLKQYYAHANLDAVNNQTKIAQYYSFSKIWFSIISISFLCLCIIVGELNFISYSGDVEWRKPWYLVILFSCLNIMTLPTLIYLDGNQQQIKSNVLNLLSILASSLSLWLSLYNGFGLYSVAVSQFFLSLPVWLYTLKRFSPKISNSFSYQDFVLILKELSAMLSKTSIIWFSGFFYWNGFNFISFHLLGAAMTGKIGLSLAMAKAGMSIASSITTAQQTVYANLIANNNSLRAISLFKKNAVISIVMLIVGYITFLFLNYYFNDFELFKKVLTNNEMIYLFLFFLSTLCIMLINNYIRCYKVEIFLKISLINSILVPLSFFISIKHEWPFFLLAFIIISISVLISFSKAKKFIHNQNRAN
ncbi:hypothetical protein BCS96_10415 [Vibrio breoganii]|uniref:O81 family O-antigen flippase n=1 Tax=Vibrio breoganii TaxID=553239 RepID=UPI000C85920F|nr:O81 family O-antigen flippase [Vibrio breoganii]PML38995.1 hypothetical protein BCT78_04740 [Vibrio breoganii]PMO99202.1 hypothetical protein BCS96_10415 [Vibrio breoganii]